MKTFVVLFWQYTGRPYEDHAEETEVLGLVSAETLEEAEQTLGLERQKQSDDRRGYGYQSHYRVPASLVGNLWEPEGSRDARWGLDLVEASVLQQSSLAPRPKPIRMPRRLVPRGQLRHRN